MRPVEPVKRNGFWYLIRRVPRRYEAFDTRRIVKVSTRIRIADDPKAVRAAPAVAQLNRDLEEEWHAKANGQKPNARKRYDNAVLDCTNVRPSPPPRGHAHPTPHWVLPRTGT
jgi:hypothetical protein